MAKVAATSSPQINHGGVSCGRHGSRLHHARAGFPVLTHVTVDDLRDLDRVLALRDQAIARGWLTGCEADRLNVIAAAVHGLRYADHNPGGLFVAMLRAHRWEMITQDDEDEARRWLRDCDEGSNRRTAPVRSALAPPIELSWDAHVVNLVQRIMARSGSARDPFLAVKQQDPTWTRDRWEQAQAELDRWQLQQTCARVRMADLQAIFDTEGPWDDADDEGSVQITDPLKEAP